MYDITNTDAADDSGICRSRGGVCRWGERGDQDGNGDPGGRDSARVPERPQARYGNQHGNGDPGGRDSARVPERPRARYGNRHGNGDPRRLGRAIASRARSTASSEPRRQAGARLQTARHFLTPRMLSRATRQRPDRYGPVPRRLPRPSHKRATSREKTGPPPRLHAGEVVRVQRMTRGAVEAHIPSSPRRGSVGLVPVCHVSGLRGRVVTRRPARHQRLRSRCRRRFSQRWARVELVNDGPGNRRLDPLVRITRHGRLGQVFANVP